MDSLSYSFKKLLFSKRETTSSFGRNGRERSKQVGTGTGIREKRASSPFEEVRLEQYAQNEKEIVTTELQSPPEGTLAFEEEIDSYRPREFSGFEEIGIGLQTNEPESLQSVADDGGRDYEGVKIYGSKADVPDDQGGNDYEIAGQVNTDAACVAVNGTNKDTLLKNSDVDSKVSKITPQGTPVLSDPLLEELDMEDVSIRPKAERHKPLTKEQFLNCFDSDGRIVGEQDVRRSIFKGGVEENIRQEVWQFLYELYPCNSTTREREIMKAEHLIRYEALKARWQPLLRDIAKDEKAGVKFCPGWFGKKRHQPPSVDHEVSRENNPFLDSPSDESMDYCDGEEVIQEKCPDQRIQSEIQPNLDLDSDKNNAIDGNPFLDSWDVEKNIKDVQAMREKLGPGTGVDHVSVGQPRSPLGIENQIVDPDTGERSIEKEVRVAGHMSSNSEPQNYFVNDADVDECEEQCVDDIREAIRDAMFEEPRYERDSNETKALRNENRVEADFYYVDGSDLPLSKTIDTSQEEPSFDQGHSPMQPLFDSGEKTATMMIEEPFRHTSGIEFQESVMPIEEVKNINPYETNDLETEISMQKQPALYIDTISDTSAIRFQEKHEHFEEENEITMNTNTLERQLSEEEFSLQNVTDISLDTSLALDYLEDDLHLEESSITLEGTSNADEDAEVDFSGLQQQVGISMQLEAAESKFLSSGEIDDSLCLDSLQHDNSVTYNNDASLDDVSEEGEAKDKGHSNEYLVNYEGEKSNFEDQDGETYRKLFDDGTMAKATCDFRPIKTVTGTGERTETDTSFRDDQRSGKRLKDKLVTCSTSLVTSDSCDGEDVKNYDAMADESDHEHNHGIDSFELELNRKPENLKSELSSNAGDNLKTDCNPGKPSLSHEDNLYADINNDLNPDYLKEESKNESGFVDKTSNVSRESESKERKGNTLSLDLSSSHGTEAHPDTKGIPIWLAQQLNASSPAGTKISKTIHIHAEGLSLVEDTSHVMPLSEITEKASLAIKQKLIESRIPVRSSTPVEFDYPVLPIESDMGDEGECTVDGHVKGQRTQVDGAETENDVTGGIHKNLNEEDGKECDELNSGDVFSCDVSQITSSNEASEEANAELISLQSKSKDDHAIARDSQLASHALRKSQSVSNITDFTMCKNSLARIQNSITASDLKISKSDSNICNPDRRRISSPLPGIIEDGHLSCPYCRQEYQDAVEIPEGFGEDWCRSVEIQAKVYAGRQSYNIDEVCQALRIIDKDVPRTDRELQYFTGSDNWNLLKLRDALISYSFFHPEVGYAQGMNDVMSRFLVVMESEADAYWMFCNYMEHFKGDFMENDMLRKINLVEQLLMKMDRELFDFLQDLQMELIFCHRWLLLSFKREFSYEDGLRIFEIMSSRHLEVSSVEAEMERSRERARELEKDEGSRMEEIYVIPEYSFDVFLCVAMLHECRNVLMSTDDMASIYQIMTSLPQIHDLNTMLSKAEDLFYRYCRKSTMDCFQLIDEPIKRTPSWRQKLHLDF